MKIRRIVRRKPKRIVMTVTADAEVDNDFVPVPEVLEEPLRALLRRKAEEVPAQALRLIEGAVDHLQRDGTDVDVAIALLEEAICELEK